MIDPTARVNQPYIYQFQSTPNKKQYIRALHPASWNKLKFKNHTPPHPNLYITFTLPLRPATALIAIIIISFRVSSVTIYYYDLLWFTLSVWMMIFFFPPRQTHCFWLLMRTLFPRMCRSTCDLLNLECIMEKNIPQVVGHFGPQTLWNLRVRNNRPSVLTHTDFGCCFF